MDVGTVVEKVEEILKDHDDLISGFNKFLPKGYEILLPPKDTVQLKDAIKYVQKIKVKILLNLGHRLILLGHDKILGLMYLLYILCCANVIN